MSSKFQWRRSGTKLARLFAALGLASAIGSGAQASVPPAREALEARVREARTILEDMPTASGEREPGAPLLAQWGNWGNWNNFSNWNNWGNWGNWFNR